MHEGHAGFAAIEDLLDDELRLLRLVLAVDQFRQEALFARRPQILAETFVGLRQDAVGRIEDRLRAAVVLLESDDRGARKLCGKIEDIAHGHRANE